MKIFLTGGTGFVGSHFINLAHLRGIEIIAQRRSPASLPRLDLNKEPTWVDCPLDELDSSHFRGCDALVHLSSHTPNPPYDTYTNCLYWNVTAAVKMFELAAGVGLKSWIVAGSCFEYGKSGERYEEIPVDAPLEPTASYPASKAAASIALSALATEVKARLLIGRIFQVFGPGELETRFWPSLKKAALAGNDFPMTSGEQVRDFVPVEQVASYFVEALFRKDIKDGIPLIENIGSGHPQSLKDFAVSWWMNWHAKGKLQVGAVPKRPNEVMRYVPKLPRKNNEKRD
ncbi:MAG: NAD-dependent epimerase/dehydratase family protein [Verrucomicrobiota bacterium]